MLNKKSCNHAIDEPVYPLKGQDGREVRLPIDRDKNAAMNIHKRMWREYGSLPNAPEMKDEA